MEQEEPNYAWASYVLATPRSLTYAHRLKYGRAYFEGPLLCYCPVCERHYLLDPAAMMGEYNAGSYAYWVDYDPEVSHVALKRGSAYVITCARHSLGDYHRRLHPNAPQYRREPRCPLIAPGSTRRISSGGY